MVDVSGLIDFETGAQSKRIFWDQDIYEQELERVFGRAWLFLTHESAVPQPGDFFSTYMGEDAVIVVRQDDGGIGAFLNYCQHRGNQLCYADSGNVSAFSCNYHGWAYGRNGDLVGVPLEQEVYFNELNKQEFGLRRVARVESYKGLVFGCFDADAPPLADYLGDMGWYMDSFLEGSGGATIVGPPMKSILRCNWKIPTENFIGDGYHIPWTHVSSLMAIGGEIGQIFQDQETLMNLGHQITTRHGHGFASASGAGPLLYKDPSRYMAYYESQRPGVIEKLGPIRGERFYGAHWNASIFPNCSFLYGTNTFKVWHPRGPHEIEVWTWSMVEDAMPEDLKKEVIHQAILTFGTAGMFESDDGENMEACTHSNRGWQTRKGRMVSNMALRHEDRNEGLPGITAQGAVGETAQRGFYRFWAEMMNAENWAAIHRNDKTWDEVLRRTAA